MRSSITNLELRDSPPKMEITVTPIISIILQFVKLLVLDYNTSTSGGGGGGETRAHKLQFSNFNSSQIVLKPPN